MTTYSVREFKARVSEILRNLEDGEEVIITRRGKPCGRLTSVPTNERRTSVRSASLRGAQCPTFLTQATKSSSDIKSIWDASDS